MKCEDAGKLIPLFTYGELSFDEEEHLELHLDDCSACRAEVKRFKAIQSALDDQESDVSSPLLVQCRRNLRASIAGMGDVPRRSGIASWFDRFIPHVHFGAPAQSIGAVALIALGFFGAKMLPGDRSPLQSMSVAGPVYERVRDVEPNAASGKVQIVVEQVSRRTLSGGMTDEPIRRLLLAAARQSNDPGVRVESLDLLKNDCSQMDVRDALLEALQHDSNPGVRLKALEALRSNASDEEVRKVLARVLLTDDNDGVRTQAIDLLTAKSNKEPALIGILQQLMVKEDNSYVRSRCQRALHDMKASAETF
jgi:hypothetical protein